MQCSNNDVNSTFCILHFALKPDFMAKNKNKDKNKKTKIEFKPYFILFYTIFIVLFFILLEILLIIINYGNDFSPFIKHNTLEKYYIDNTHYANKYYLPEKASKSHKVKNLFLTKKPSDTKRGFVIGGSTAEGFPYFSNQSFGKIIEGALNYSKNRYKFEILNLSFSAMSSYYVNDTMKKLKKYDPDFFIIYSGQNEYYGSISATTSKFHIFRKMYIFLRNFRTVQLIQNLSVRRGGVKSNENKTLMEEQFNDKSLERNEKYDQYVAKCYIKNIENSIKLYTNKNIPIFLIEPISNFIDMPPFESKDEDKHSELIIEYNDAIEKKDINRVVTIESKINSELFNKNAHFKYLQAKKENILNNYVDLEKYIEAKDLDMNPFRARSNINRALKEFSNKNKYKNLKFIELLDIIKNDYNSSFDNSIFIDHLHFNRNGQKLIAKIITENILSYYSDMINTTQQPFKEKLNEFYSNDELIEKYIHYFPTYDDTSVFLRMHGLINSSPFKDMKIKYEENPLPINEITKNQPLLDQLSKTSDFTNILKIIQKKYMDEKNINSLIKIFSSLMFSYPLEYENYYSLCYLYEQLKQYDNVEYYLIRGVLVSDRNKKMTEVLETFYKAIQMPYRIDQIKKLRDFPTSP